MVLLFYWVSQGKVRFKEVRCAHSVDSILGFFTLLVGVLW